MNESDAFKVIAKAIFENKHSLTKDERNDLVWILLADEIIGTNEQKTGEYE